MSDLTREQLQTEERWHDFTDRLSENGRSAAGLEQVGYVELAPVVLGDRSPERPVLVPRSDAKGLAYPGRAHSINGEPGVGKSLLAAHAVAGALRSGRGAVVVDFESTPDLLVERLTVLGVPAETIANPGRLVYLRPLARLTDAAIALVPRLGETVDAEILEIDAVGAAMAVEGLEENSNSDFARWFTRLVRPWLARPWAVLLIDHVGRDPSTRTRGARGAGAKLGLVDVSYSARRSKPFSRTQAGSFKLVCEKDRLANYTEGETVAVVNVDPAGPELLTVEAPTEQTGDTWQPTGYMERLSIALERHEQADEPPPSRTDTLALIPGNADHKRTALAALVTAGHFEKYEDGRARRYRVIRPYRENPD